MSRTRFATPLMLSLTAAGSLGRATAQAAITDLPQGYGLTQDTAAPAKQKETPARKAEPQEKSEHEGKCGEGKCGEGMCGADHHAKPDENKPDETTAKSDKTDTEGKCGEGKCGEGQCGGAA